ncbi:DNA segregation ATPase FtsK SpoIIIE related protein [Furfurilactobacillus siliginis]|uniref:DNA translocase FtsK n=1 Tax=Furfurilactobacillus siliginis TaxID=348151 RepID=A0A0R2L9U8_9LACO|nr:DNA segregation ATPase FtsK SpoIIIE related protein [Furfurilactobacillus siliginis]
MTGLVVALIALMGLLRLGAGGIFIANSLAILVGNTNQVLAILLIVAGIIVGVAGHLPKLPVKQLVGGGLVYFGVLIYDHLRLFTGLNYHTKFVALTWGMLGDNFRGGTLNGNTGGGMLGAYGYAACYHLVANLGTAILSTVLLFVGGMLLLNIPFATVSNGLLASWRFMVTGGQKAAAWTQRFVQDAVTQNATPDKPVKKPAEPEAPTVTEPTTPTVEAPVVTPTKPIPTPAPPKITVAADHADKDKPEPEQAALDLGDPGADLSDYQLPTAALLTKIPQTDQSNEYNAIEKNSQTLQKTLASFGVDAEVKNVSLGPSVTKYELHPAIGVKVSKIVNLADDLALALAAKDIRIEAPIPGKSLIGIEVPNKEILTVSFRDVIEHEPAHPNKVLTVPLGRDVTGNIVMSDLTKMPHLLIAGSTGSGKSVAINGIITSLLMQAKPNQVKFMLIDPKRVELSVYNDIPHLLTPVVSEPKRAAKALNKVVEEMTRRYELFANFGVRNIDGYNKLAAANNEHTNVAQPTMPYVVAIVDELADLMMTVSSEVEGSIIRIAQMGRAAGIHMILATQRPSVDVITGLIKANVPSRIAFAVSSGIDSRTILDSNGAEKLLGRGDMLYEPIDQNKPVRVQGEFISDKDVAAVVDFIKAQQTAEYDDSMTVSDAELSDDSAEEHADELDELFDDAVAFVQDQKKASTSLLQRRFRIGYNRAARMIDDMEARGIVGPADGSRPRQVL